MASSLLVTTSCNDNEVDNDPGHIPIYYISVCIAIIHYVYVSVSVSICATWIVQC